MSDKNKLVKPHKEAVYTYNATKNPNGTPELRKTLNTYGCIKNITSIVNNNNEIYVTVVLQTTLDYRYLN